MTSRLVYEALLIELNKKDAPNILLESFNYLCNKAINQYVNKHYNIYDTSLQTTDDLRVLKATSILTPLKCNRYGSISDIGRMLGATYEVILPQDYVHLLNCICVYKVNKTFKCYNAGDIWRCPAKRLTSDLYSLVLDNFWNRPSYNNPYYYINEVNNGLNNIYLPTNDIRPLDGTDDGDSPQENDKKYYIGTLLPTANNYLDILNNLGRNSIKGIYSLTDWSKTYVLYPSDANVTLWDESQTMQIATTEPVTINDYKMISSIQECYGRIFVKSTGGGRSSDNNIKIGNDYILGKISNTTDSDQLLGTDAFGNNILNVDKNGGIPNYVTLKLRDGSTTNASNIERSALVRYGNSTLVRMEIRYGTDASVFELHRVVIDYIKAPQFIRLTLEQLDLTEDTSQVLEFPDYVCQEIINELVHIVMENIGDPKLQTHPVVSLSIATQQLIEQPQTTRLLSN